MEGETIETDVTRLFDIKYPILLAGMRHVALNHDLLYGLHSFHESKCENTIYLSQKNQE